MDLLQELKNLEEVDIIKEIKDEALPLVMWGAGSSAPEVSFYLKCNGIQIDDVFVDDEYYIEGIKFEEKEVLSYSMLCQKYDKVNVIFGNANYEKKTLLETRKCINKIYALFSISYNVFEKTSLYEIEKYKNEFEQVYDLLEDNKSKENYIAFLKTRVSGNNKYIMDVFEEEQTFFHNQIFQINNKEVYLDVGAYDGDTIRLFLNENQGKYKYIYAVEPDKKNNQKLKAYIEEKQLTNIEITDKGAWNCTEEQYFSSGEQVSSVISSKKIEKDISSITVKKIDDMFDYLEKITLIKINYFVGVKETIEGATKLLVEHCPKLAITIGFDCRNIRYIPQIINKINPQYRLYLRYNRGMVSGLTLYGIVL